MVGIGKPESAAQFLEASGFALADNLLVDPERKCYKSLELYGDLDGSEGWFFDPKVVEGVRRLFFNKQTGEALKERGQEKLKEATKNFKPIAPPEPRDAVQQGGLFVFECKKVLFAHKDEVTGVLAKKESFMAAVAK